MAIFIFRRIYIMKQNRKQIILVTILALAVMMTTGCIGGGGGAIEAPAGAPNGAVMAPITGSCMVEVASGKVIVSSDADIMDGAFVVLSVNAMDSDTLAETVIVKNGDNLKAEFAIEDDWGDEVYGFVVMSPELNGKQAEHILAIYGEHFEKVEADNMIYNKKDYMYVVMSDKIALK
jgi:hypothetical protein